MVYVFVLGRIETAHVRSGDDLWVFLWLRLCFVCKQCPGNVIAVIILWILYIRYKTASFDNLFL